MPIVGGSGVSASKGVGGEFGGHRGLRCGFLCERSGMSELDLALEEANVELDELVESYVVQYYSQWGKCR